MTIRINLDDPRQLSLFAQNDFMRGECLGAFPKPIAAKGLVQRARSFNDTPDKLVDPKDYKEIILKQRAELVFPEFHEARSWAKLIAGWNQGQLSYCWAWAVAAAVMDVRAREGKPTTLLAPISLGGAVNWRNAGNYLESAMQYVIDHGIASAEYCPPETWRSRNPNLFREGWQEDALRYRVNPEHVWWMDNSSAANMIRHCITAMRQGDPLYAAWYSLAHAMTIVGVAWDERVPYNLVWRVRNSHNESEPIEMTGERAVPDEVISIMATAS